MILGFESLRFWFLEVDFGISHGWLWFTWWDWCCSATPETVYLMTLVLLTNALNLFFKIVVGFGFNQWDLWSWLAVLMSPL